MNLVTKHSIFNRRTGYLVLFQTDENIFFFGVIKGTGQLANFKAWLCVKHYPILKPTAERTQGLKKSFTFFFWIKLLLLFIWRVLKCSSFLWFPNNKFHRCIWQNDNIKLKVHSPGTKKLASCWGVHSCKPQLKGLWWFLTNRKC